MVKKIITVNNSNNNLKKKIRNPNTRTKRIRPADQKPLEEQKASDQQMK